MHFDLIQAICLGSKPDVPNDDRIGCRDQHAWVIDGATDLGDPGLFGRRGGAAWIAAAADAAFANAAGPINELCVEAFKSVASSYVRDRTREPIARWELPRAAFAVVAIEGDTLTCAYAGDCSVLHRSGDGVTYVTNKPDRKSEREMAAALGTGVGAQNLSSEIVVADRRASRSGPTKVLSIDAAETLASTKFNRIPVSRGDDVVFMSDGFAALIDAYEVYNMSAFFAAIETLGLAALADELRKIEFGDAACLRFPRFKVGDDASALWVRIG